ncbi:MAG TPA: ArsR family transcriptional regulator, partial [Thermopetrobacter sp.]|nr:ArsR family transcriptional regulator [Thermopetrobacter sp.]
HEARLRILCLLLDGEKSVGHISERLGMRQAAVSQQLQRLRAENLVAPRRQGKEIYYRVCSGEVVTFMQVLYEIYCSTES